MEIITAEKLRGSINKWWTMMILGLVLVAAGLWIFFYLPAHNLARLDRLLGILILLAGVAEMVVTAGDRDTGGRWWWRMIIGGLEVAAGLLMLLLPGLSFLLLAGLIALWLATRGAFLIIFAFRLRQIGGQSWSRPLVGGILTILLGFCVFNNPFPDSVGAYFWVAVGLIACGAFHLQLSLMLRELKKELP